ncbi:MAG: N-6 DNA methylase [Thaumarchaeota archaeon]|nr:N-6 DNA methylase [Nitrososphaerota archaeon]
MDRRELANKIEQVCEIMRRDGLTILGYMEQLSWLIFLKIFEDLEKEYRLEAEFEGRTYEPIIDPKYSWSNWARGDMKAEELKNFIETDLLRYLRELRGSKERNLIATLFAEVRQQMRDPFNLKEVVTMLSSIDFTNPEDSHTLSQLYEELLMMMGREGGAAGEYYTPRPIVRLMVKIVNPKIGETVFDPLAGSCGFLVESFRWMKEQRKLTTEEYQMLEEKTFYAQELKALPYLIGTMNCILHGLLLPNIVRRDTFEENVVDTPSQRFDVILTNPPFGGSLAKTLQENLPVPTGSTELAALQYCMRKLKKGGRCGIVLPEGVLFRGGAYKRVKMELLKEFNVHTIISLPPGTFAHIAPKGGTGPKANLVFFDRTGPTKEIWYYELIPPNGENYTKANPVKDEHLADCYGKWKNRKVSENSWIVSIEEIRERDYDLTARNPNRKQETVYAEPEELVESILEKERQILEILEEFRNILGEGHE